jgi:hypothetical protein
MVSFFTSLLKNKFEDISAEILPAQVAKPTEIDNLSIRIMYFILYTKYFYTYYY